MSGHEPFDYVIVGAGSAGCVLAHRLSADPSVRVLLIEAGGPDTDKNIHIPAAFGELLRGPNDWAYDTEPQPHLAGRRLFWPRGKVLGGTSSINAMIYIRGHRSDYDAWRDLGNDGWDYESVLPYFKRSQDQQRGASQYHGAGGPLTVSDLRDPNPLSRTFVDAAEQSGIARNDDFNGAEQSGCGLYQVTQRAGQRCSTAVAYLKPILSRSNLTVWTHTHVTRLLLDAGRCLGLEARREGETVRIVADREVILSGGAINSPQILMLSGIGPADELARLGIRMHVDLPGVGQNLQDHLSVVLTWQCKRPVTLERAKSIGPILKYLCFHRGMLTSNVGEAGAFIHTADPDAPPDVQFHFAPGYFMQHGFIKRDDCGISLGPTLLRPRSVGTIRLRSDDPFAAPIIDPNYLDQEPDLDVLVAGIKKTREVLNASAFDEFRGPEVWPGADATTDEQLADHVRQRSETLYHPVGTCKMGSDDLAVVDDRLRVRGVAQLRVVDASIMPNIVAGNTNAPTIMIAEKAAELIVESPTPAAKPASVATSA